LEPVRAAQELQKLRDEAESPEVQREGPEHEAWKAKTVAVMQGGLGRDSDTLHKFREMRYHVGIWTGAPGEEERDARYFAIRVKEAAALIDAAIYELGLSDSPDEGSHVAPTGPIFVVHGHNDARKYELMRLLDRTVDLPAIVLHEEANKGGTILEKFERHAQSASFAVVLLTGDDEGRLRDTDRPLVPRGRQNVILELGVFIGLLGRERVVVLKDHDVEEPSDLSGLMYIPLDDAGAWRTQLLKELGAAGIKVDHSRIP
jgi:predicted nucleotide-binding protein